VEDEMNGTSLRNSMSACETRFIVSITELWQRRISPQAWFERAYGKMRTFQ